MNRTHRQPTLKDPPLVRVPTPSRAGRAAIRQRTQRERELALGGLMLSVLTFCWGLLLGGGIVGALVAIF